MIYFLAILFGLQTYFCFGEIALNWNAQAYHRNARRQKNVARQVLKNYSFEVGSKILDVGCGTGKTTHKIAKKVTSGSVLGIDISSKMIQHAQKEYTNMPNLSFMEMDVTKLFFKNYFDYVVSFFCLHWIQDKEAALRCITKALKPNGILLLLVTTDDEQPLLQSYVKAMHQPKWQHYFKNYELPLYLVNPENCVKTLNQLGCSYISIERSQKFNYFSCKKQFKKHLKALPLALEHLSPDLHNDFLDDVMQEYLNMYPLNQDGSINYFCPFCVLTAKKLDHFYE